MTARDHFLRPAPSRICRASRALAALLLLGLCTFGLAIIRNDADATVKQPTLDTTHREVDRDEPAQVLTFQGQVEHGSEIEFIAEADSSISSTGVRYGQRVTRGQALLRLTANELEAEIVRLQGDLDAATHWLNDRYPHAKTVLDGQLRAAERQLERGLDDARARVTAHEQAVRAGIATVDELLLAREALRNKEDELSSLVAQRKLDLENLAREHLLNSKIVRSSTYLLDARLAARERLDIVAPFDGIVTGMSELLAQDRASPIRRGQYLLTIAKLDEPIATITISPHEAHLFARAQSTKCFIKRVQIDIECTTMTAQRTPDASRYVVRVKLAKNVAQPQFGDIVTVTITLPSRDEFVEAQHAEIVGSTRSGP